MWLGCIKVVFQREEGIALKGLKYSAGPVRQSGINGYKNPGAPGLLPAPGTGRWLRSSSSAHGDVPGLSAPLSAALSPFTWGGGCGGDETPTGRAAPRRPSAGLGAGPGSQNHRITE